MKTPGWLNSTKLGKFLFPLLEIRGNFWAILSDIPHTLPGVKSFVPLRMHISIRSDDVITLLVVKQYLFTSLNQTNNRHHQTVIRRKHAKMIGHSQIFV